MPDWETLHPTWSPVISSIARQASGRVAHLRYDLYQAGWEALLEHADERDPMLPENHGWYCATIHNTMKDYRSTWLSGNVRKSTHREQTVVTQPTDNGETLDQPRGVVVSADSRGAQLRTLLSPRAIAILGAETPQSPGDRLFLMRERRKLAGRIGQLRPGPTCWSCQGHPEYLGMDGLWRCYLHKVGPVVLFNHPNEQTVWTPDRMSDPGPKWATYERRTPAPEASPWFDEWLTETYTRWGRDYDDPKGHPIFVTLRGSKLPSYRRLLGTREETREA